MTFSRCHDDCEWRLHVMMSQHSFDQCSEKASRCSCLGGFTSILTGTLNPLPTEAEEVHLARKKTESARSGRQGITFPIVCSLPVVP
ncbi:TPA: hypothetical protein BOS_19709 [Bos taurus]|nr:TPA: hypothetical protein BOS_19709 [Bos taurus]